MSDSELIYKTDAAGGASNRLHVDATCSCAKCRDDRSTIARWQGKPADGNNGHLTGVDAEARARLDGIRAARAANNRARSATTVVADEPAPASTRPLPLTGDDAERRARLEGIRLARGR